MRVCTYKPKPKRKLARRNREGKQRVGTVESFIFIYLAAGKEIEGTFCMQKEMYAAKERALGKMCGCSFRTPGYKKGTSYE